MTEPNICVFVARRNPSLSILPLLKDNYIT